MTSTRKNHALREIFLHIYIFKLIVVTKNWKDKIILKLLRMRVLKFMYILKEMWVKSARDDVTTGMKKSTEQKIETNVRKYKGCNTLSAEMSQADLVNAIQCSLMSENGLGLGNVTRDINLPRVLQCIAEPSSYQRIKISWSIFRTTDWCWWYCKMLHLHRTWWLQIWVKKYMGTFCTEFQIS